MRSAFEALRQAVLLLTVIPVGRGSDREPTEASLAAARYAFGFVGLAIGLVLAALSALEAWAGAGPLLAGFLLVAVEVALTGALHLDGLADTADGLFLPGGPDRRLAAMRDPHLGSFGACALALVLLGKTAALASLPGATRSLALVAACTLSRTFLLVAAGRAPYARSEGTGRIVVAATTRSDAIGAAITGCALGGLILPHGGLTAAISGVALALGLATLAQNRLNGITGDILGALVELEELVILVILALFHPFQSI
jgi:adenosylcobinamide-GDP ribazoletransferase